MTKLITYVDSSEVKPFQFRPGSEWSVLFEDAQTGQRAILVKWEPGYQMEQVDHHESDEIVRSLRNLRAEQPSLWLRYLHSSPRWLESSGLHAGRLYFPRSCHRATGTIGTGHARAAHPIS
jgi:hypothetical protein